MAILGDFELPFIAPMTWGKQSSSKNSQAMIIGQSEGEKNKTKCSLKFDARQPNVQFPTFIMLKNHMPLIDLEYVLIIAIR